MFLLYSCNSPTLLQQSLLSHLHF